MNKPIILVIPLLIVSIGLLSGCAREGYDPYTKAEDIEKIVGTWYSETINETLVIIYDTQNGWHYEGRIIINSTNYNFSLYYGKIHIKGIDTNNSTYKYSFSDNDNILTLTNVRSGISIEYTKQ
jgi:hypothetical protein